MLPHGDFSCHFGQRMLPPNLKSDIGGLNVAMVDSVDHLAWCGDGKFWIFLHQYFEEIKDKRGYRCFTASTSLTHSQRDEFYSRNHTQWLCLWFVGHFSMNSLWIVDAHHILNGELKWRSIIILSVVKFSIFWRKWRWERITDDIQRYTMEEESRWHSVFFRKHMRIILQLF